MTCPRLVFDTSVVLSALLFPAGTVSWIRAAWLEYLEARFPRGRSAPGRWPRGAAFPKSCLALGLLQQPPGATQQGSSPTHRHPRHFPNRSPLLCLVGAVLAEENHQWAIGRVVAMLVDEPHHQLPRRSSSARAKYADALRRISLTLQLPVLPSQMLESLPLLGRQAGARASVALRPPYR